MNKLLELKIREWGAVLWKRWEPGAHINSIVGFWAEDGNEYKIIVPAQIRDIVISIQNYLSDIYVEIENLKSRINKLTQYFNY